MEKMISKNQIHNLYAIASRKGLVESGNRDDNFHCLVYRITQKLSVKELTEKEYYKLRGVLTRNQENRAKFKKEKSIQTAGMTEAQISKAWALLYDIAANSERKATIGERMVGAIKKILDIDADVKEPFRWLSLEQGNKLIEQLKRYQTSVKKSKVRA